MEFDHGYGYEANSMKDMFSIQYDFSTVHIGFRAPVPKLSGASIVEILLPCWNLNIHIHVRIRWCWDQALWRHATLRVTVFQRQVALIRPACLMVYAWLTPAYLVTSEASVPCGSDVIATDVS